MQKQNPPRGIRGIRGVRKVRGAMIVAAAALAVSNRSAQAVTDYFWNQTAGGTGSWDTSFSIWASVAGGANDHTWTSDGTERANFQNSGGTVTIQPGGVTAAGINISTGTNPAYTITGGVLTLTDTATINNSSAATITAVITGSGGLTKTSNATLTLNAANTYTGATNVTGGTLLGVAQASGSPFSNGAVNLTNGTLRLNSVGVATTTSVGDLTVSAASNTWAGASNITIDNSNAGLGVKTTLAAGNLVRGGQGSVLGITPITSHLGDGQGETLTFTGGTTLTNGILPAWVVAQASGTSTAVDFTTYGANGVAPATYTSTDITTSTNTSVVNQNTPVSAVGNVAAYALKTNAAINLGGNTLSLGDGTGVSGLILNAGGGITNGNINFGSVEGVVTVQGTTTLGASGNTIASRGLTITASGTANTNIGGTIVDDGANPTKLILTGVTSGTGFTLGAANTYSGGTILSVNTGSGQNIVLGSDTAFGTGKLVNILAPGSSSPQFQATAPRKIANDMDLNGGLTWTGTNAQTYSGAINIINAATGGQRTLSASTSGLTVTLGDPGTPKTITLGNPVANGGDGVGKEVVFNAATGATLVVNDVLQDPAAGGGTASGSVQYGGGGGGIVQVNALNTYTGGTDLNTGPMAVQFNHSFNVGDTSGPFGTGTLRGNSSTNVNLQPVGGNRTLANPLAMGGGGVTFSNATGDTSSLTLTGPISLSTSAGRTIANNLGSGQTLTLGDPNSPSTITGSATGGAILVFNSNGPATNSNFTVINDVIRDNGATPTNVTISNANNQGSTVTLNALNTYSGATLLNGSGTIIRLPVSSNAIGLASTAGPFGSTGQIQINNGTNQHLRPVGGDRMISNPILMTTGFAMDNATGENFNLTFSGAITMTNNRFISNGFAAGTSGGTMVIGHSAGTTTLTMPTTGNFTLSLAALAGPIVINDLIQDASPSLLGIVAINPQNGDNNPVTLNNLNTYSGGTSIGGGTVGGGTVIVGSSSNGPAGSFTAGPFGVGGMTMNQSTGLIITPAGADRSVSNSVTLTSGFTAQNTTPLNLTFTGPMTAAGATARTITSNMVTGSALILGDIAAPQAMTLSCPLTFSSALAPGAGGLIVVNDVVQNGTANASISVTGGATVQFMNGNNTYSGGTTLTQGAIGLGVETSGVGGSVASGPIGTGTLTVNPSSGQTASLFSVGGPHTLGNNVTLAGSPLIFTGSNVTTLAGTVDLNGGNRQLQVDSPAGATISGTIIGTLAGLQKTGTGTLTVTGNNTYNGMTSVFGGVLSVGSSSNLGDGSATNNLSFNTGGTLRATGPLASSSRSVTMTGPGTIDAQAAVSLGDFTGAGSLTKTGASPLTIKSAHIGNLTVSNGTLAVAANGTSSGVAIVNSTTVAAGAKLDLSDNHLIDHTTGVGSATGGVYNALTGLIQSGRNGGGWGGNGIITSQSTAASGNFTTLAIAKASEVKGLATATTTATWAGQTVSGSDSLVMYTYGGDANLDGKINVDDYGRIDSSIPLGIAGWYNGDFNYDGKINVDDYGIIDSNIGIQGSPFVAVGGASAGLAASGLSGVSAVPEPATFSMLALGAAALVGRRRRRSR